MASADASKRSGTRTGKSSHSISLIDIVQNLKEQITDKERQLTAKSRALKEQSQFMERVIASLAESVVVFNLDGTIQSLNPATRDLLGYQDEELVGLPASILCAKAQHAELFRGSRFRALLQGDALTVQEMIYRGRDGQEIPVIWKGSPVLNDEGVVKGFVSIAHDARLERKIYAEKIKAVRAMAASVAHEIRNPLNAIQNSVALLLRDLELTGDDQVLMEIVNEETQRISNIVHQFLRFARPAPSQLQVGSLGPLLDELVTLMRVDERVTSSHRVDCEIAEGLPAVRFDPDKIKQVLWNLVANALDAMPEGGVVAIRACVSQTEGVQMEIEDNGSGIDPEVLPRLFDPFVTTKSRGSGLGLAVVKAIVEAHGGELRVDTMMGRGTRFILGFPKAG